MIVDGNRTIASLNELSRLAADSMEASVALIAEDLAAAYNAYAKETGATWSVINSNLTYNCLAPYICPLIFGFSNKVSGTGGRMFNAW